jgi:hypothetical protein
MGGSSAFSFSEVKSKCFELWNFPSFLSSENFSPGLLFIELSGEMLLFLLSSVKIPCETFSSQQNHKIKLKLRKEKSSGKVGEEGKSKKMLVT